MRGLIRYHPTWVTALYASIFSTLLPALQTTNVILFPGDEEKYGIAHLLK